jgi:CheY-like chemotaxis protein
MPKPTSLLVIEPHENLRDAYASVLRFAGYRVHEASCVVTAREHLLAARPSLVLVNVHLPTSGEAISLMRRCRTDRALDEVTWVAICEDEMGLDRAEQSEFDAVLRTPLRYADLLGAAGVFGGAPPSTHADRAWELCFS